MSSTSTLQYTLDQSPFYRLSSKKKLAKLLNISQDTLNELEQSESLYEEIEITEDGKKPRIIEKPKPQLKQVQKRIANLLSRIETPEYLFCPAKKRSNISNAKQHANNSVICKLDIQAYFPSTESWRVNKFFHQKMLCAVDIAYILTALSTYKGHLPTGSPASPILSYYTYLDMWDAIKKIVCEASCILTVYMDDLTISGQKIPDKLMWQIKQKIHLFGLKYHKEKCYNAQIRQITGVIIRDKELRLPNKKHLKIHELRRKLEVETNPEQRAKLRQKIQGLEAYARQLDRLSVQ